MALTTGSANLSYLATQVGQLLVIPTLKSSVAAQVLTVVSTANNSYRIPVITDNGNAANWTAEGTEISPTDPTLSELVSIPLKLSGLTILSSEIVADGSEATAKLIGESLARDLAAKLDAALFGDTTADGPDGLLSLTTSTSVETAATFSTLDSFAAAIFKAEGLGATISSFVTSPAEALALSTLKELDNSTRPLLTSDVTTPTERAVYGRPLLVAPSIGAKIAWGIPKDRCYLVLRDDARIDVDKSVFFTSDRVAVRSQLRATFAFPHELGIVKISHA